jgi:thioredoxin reductase
MNNSRSLAIEEAWGQSIFQCPYCHGWEVRERRWGYLALGLKGLQHGFPSLLRNWTNDVTVFTNGAFDIPHKEAEELVRAGVQIEPRSISRLVCDDGQLTSVELSDDERIACDILYAHPPQQHVEVVRRLGLALDDTDYVQVDPMTLQTSSPGIYAAGDLTTRMQGAVFAAAAGAQAGAMVNHDLSSMIRAGSNRQPS